MNDTERIIDLYTHLVHGWDEYLEWHERIITLKGDIIIEARAKNVRQAGLISQLQTAIYVKGSGNNQGPSSNKPGSRPPINMPALELLDDIQVGAQTWHDSMRDELYSTPRVVGNNRRLVQVLANNIPLSQSLQHVRPSLTRAYLKDMNKWVKRARILLGYDQPLVMLKDTVCGECGGALAVATDASTDVKCVGKPYDDPQIAEPPCGVVYPRFRWLEMVDECPSASA